MLRNVLLPGIALILCVAAAPRRLDLESNDLVQKRDVSHSARCEIEATVRQGPRPQEKADGSSDRSRWAPTQTGAAWQTWYPQATSQTYPQSASRTTSAYVSSSLSTSLVSESPTLGTNSGTSTQPTATGPCASVAELAASYTDAQPSAVATVPAQLAYECLVSIPFNQSAAIQYLDSIDPYLNWQTTFEYLKSPPADYASNVQPPYDFYATWAEIKANTSANAYQSEYEFGWTVYRAAQIAHDGHFVFYPDSVNGIFSFGRPFPLVSISLDGASDPQPYLYSDIIASSSGSTDFVPSPIVQIDGQDAIEYLLVWSQYGSLQDPDALWNNLFWEPAQIALASQGTGTGTFSGGGRGRWPYPGPSTTLSFANGSSVTGQNFARVLLPFDNVTSGEDVYTNFLTPPPEAYENVFQYVSSLLAAAATSTSAASSATASSSTVSSSVAPTSIPAPAYPTPFVSETNNLNGGYFIDEPGYEDVAILVVRSFVGTAEDELPFQAVNTYFIETAAALGKTKLIIDVSANGGGTILQGYDIFKQLFPSILPYGASRYRAHEAFNLLGEQTSYLSGLVPRSLDDNYTYIDIESSAFNYRTDVDVNYDNFDSWAEKYGPDILGPQPDTFGSIIRWNMTDVLTPENSGGIDISGYLNRSNITTQPFTPENIILVTDGYCASTCSIFSELMTQQGGVKTVALGGRPGLGSNSMQAVGGVKGSNDLDFVTIFGSIAEVWAASNSSLQSEWENSVLNQYTALPFYRSTAAVLNVRNAYRQGDASNTPLQFVYEPADCRILYTAAMVVDETAVWKTVADSVWGGGAGDACVAGGFGADRTRSIRSDGDTVRDRLRKRELHSARKETDYEAILNSFSTETGDFAGRDGDSILIL